MVINLNCLPIKNMDLKKITGNRAYGMRIHPVYKTPAMHYGIDDPEPKGTPIYAVADGTVAVSKMQGDGKGAGEYIVIDHGGYFSYYAHQSKRAAKTGDKVKAGQLIGYVGSTGDSTGPHLHFGVCTKFVAASLNKSAWVDPLPILKKYGEKTKEDEEEMAEKVYKTLDEVPSWGKETVKKIIARGGITPTENSTATINDDEINLTHSMLRIYVSMDKMKMI